MNMQIGHMAVPSTWKTFQTPNDHPLAGWWAVSNDVESVTAYFRQKEEAETYRDLGENGETMADLSPPDPEEF